MAHIPASSVITETAHFGKLGQFIDGLFYDCQELALHTVEEWIIE